MRKRLGLLFVVILLILLDQGSKAWILSRYGRQMGESIPLWNGVLHLRLMRNEGVAFGFFQHLEFLPLLLSIAALIALPLLRHFLLPKGALIDYGTAMVLAGGASNLLDRLLRGYVVDFLEIRLFTFAIFNVADIFVTLGILLLVIAVLRSSIGKEEKPA